LAEFIGAALGLYLLFGIPMLPAALITAAGSFIILEFQRRGFRPLEARITQSNKYPYCDPAAIFVAKLP
ncbi:divalent metal cation transporter, partial [Bacillus sp. D-CC]